MGKTITSFRELAELRADEIMTSPVITVHVWDSIHAVAEIFSENNISCAAVVDADDIPLAVISKSDLARYDRERATLVTSLEDRKAHRARRTSESIDQKGFHLEPEEATIEHWMTPVFFDVQPETNLATITRNMVKNGLHHIFVTDGETRKIKGIITTFDVAVLLSRILNPAESAFVDAGEAL